MPIRRARKQRKGRKGARRSRAPPRSIRPLTQMAAIRETIEVEALLANTPYGLSFSLSQFARASSIAPFFRWYKAKSVDWQFEPAFNTFQIQATSTGGTQVPYLYTTMNRNQLGVTGVASLNDFLAVGTKPIKFTTKQSRKFKPNWCSPGLLAVGSVAPNTTNTITMQGYTPNYGWLSSPNSPAITNGFGYLQTPLAPSTQFVPPGSSTSAMVGNVANQTLYNGMVCYVEQGGNLAGVEVARLTCTVIWEFKDPCNNTSLADPIQDLSGALPQA